MDLDQVLNATNPVIEGERAKPQEPKPFRGRGRLNQLVAELERQRASRVDFVADGRSLRVLPAEHFVTLAPGDAAINEWLPALGLPFLPTALAQIGNRCSPKVPGGFAQDLALDYPELASGLLSGLLNSGRARHLIRCLDGAVRAVLSDSYRVLDNYDLAFTALDTVRQVGGEVLEASLSDSHMRLKFTTRQIWDTVAEEQDRNGTASHKWIGDVGGRQAGPEDLPGGGGTVHPVVTISNSETGHGGLNVSFGLLKAICCNMAVVEKAVSQIHLGSKQEVGIYSEETVAADSKAIMLKARDAVKAAFDPKRFALLVNRAKLAAEDKIEAPMAAVVSVAEVGGLTEEAKDGILAHFLRDYCPNRYGLAQATARYAQDVVDPESAALVEELAGRVLTEKNLIRRVVAVA